MAPPPPQSMLEMCIRSRGLACRGYFPTLIGGAGGPPKVAILETGRNTTFGALLETLCATNISGFVATALIWPPFLGGRHMTLPEACKTGIPDLGWLRAIFVHKLQARRSDEHVIISYCFPRQSLSARVSGCAPLGASQCPCLMVMP